jgi:hypothetical protein
VKASSYPNVTKEFANTELFASWDLARAWRDKGGQHARFADRGGVHLDNLWTVAQLTQQLYLGLPDLLRC